MSKSKLGRAEPPNFSFPAVRTRLLDELCAATPGLPKIVAITAPTGHGKTVLGSLLFEHMRAAGGHCLWTTLSERDTTLDRVLSLLERILEPDHVARSPLSTPDEMLQGDVPAEDRIDALIERITGFDAPTTIFVDNLSFCRDETLRALLDALVFGTPSWIHFVFVSNSQLPMNTARAKLEGRIREVGYAELCFTAAEIEALLGPELCTQLGPEAVEAIVRQTEGWPAAVRLMHIILASSPQPREALARFSGADEDLAELLNRQVLGSFEQPLREFLLEIAPLRSFCVELCRHATGDRQAAAHVATLLRQNVFMIPLDRNRKWYRLHGLFREFLCGEAQTMLAPARQREVLERAAAWSEGAGQWQEAVDYALAAGALEAASAILERIAALFVRDRGDLRQFIDWVELIRKAGAEVGWQADFWYVWALVFHRRYDFARLQVERLSRRIEEARAKAADTRALDELKRAVDVHRITIDTYTDRLPEAYAGAVRWLAEPGADDPFNVATVCSAAGIHLGSSFDYVGARRLMQQAQASIAQAQSAYGAAWVSLLTAMVSLGEGDFANAYQDLKAVLTRARAALGESSGMAGTIALVCAKCAVELGLDAEARDHLALGLKRAQTHGVTDTIAHGLDAAVKLWTGAAEDPISLPEMRDIASSYPPRVGFMLGCLLVQRFVRLGRLEAAEAEVAQLGLPLDAKASEQDALQAIANPRAQELAALALIDLLIAKGRLRQAEALINAQGALARDRSRVATQVELALASAAVSACSQNTAPAGRHLVRAIGLAARRGLVRPFRDRVEMIAGLVNETKAKSWGFAVEEERRFFAEICRNLPMRNVALLDQLDGLQIAPALLDTPTARELELLDLIEAGLSNQQLADRLSVSVATVKWHLYNLYAKLGVSSRSAALARARALNLLSR